MCINGVLLHAAADTGAKPRVQLRTCLLATIPRPPAQTPRLLVADLSSNFIAFDDS